MKPGFITSIAIIVLFSQTASAQQSGDYVVAVKGDTLTGKVTLMAFDKIDQVQVRNEKRTILTALQVRQVKYNGDTYRPVTYDNKLRFMKVLRDGYLSVLAFQTTPSNSAYDGMLLMKADGEMIENPRLGFRKAMPEFLNDPVLGDSIAAGLLTRNDLFHVVDQYNRNIQVSTLSRMREQVAVAKAGETLLTQIGKITLDAERLPEANKKDLLDILEDIKWKTSSGLRVPPYMEQALLNAVSGHAGLEAEAETLIRMFPKKP